MHRTIWLHYAYWLTTWVGVTLMMSLPAHQYAVADDAAAAEARRPENEAELEYWLRNMVAHHRFSPAEVVEATGLSLVEVDAALDRFAIVPGEVPASRPGDALRVMPYPGGRHPRLGFLDGAVRPQRESKVSVFCPWDAPSYVVVDVPEAIRSNLGIIYLAHTHVDTVWTVQGIELPRLEWQRHADGTLHIARRLPNGIEFETDVAPAADHVAFEIRLTNGTDALLTGMRVQNCVMLKGAAGFAEQTIDNKVFSRPYSACRSEDGRRWIITGWEPILRAWGNPNCPCLHSDPQLPDCSPGETVRVFGRLWFYEGDDIEQELRRLDATGWRD